MPPLSDQSNSRVDGYTLRAAGERLARALFRAAMKAGNTDPNLSGPWQADTTRWAFDLDLPDGRHARVSISIGES